MNLIKYKINDTGIVKEYTRCVRCGKPLKTPESRKLGYGQTCLVKRQQEKLKRKLF